VGCARIAPLLKFKAQLAQNPLDLIFVLGIVRRKQKMNIDRLGGGLDIKAKLDIGKDTERIFQAAIFEFSFADLFVGLNGEVVGDTQRSDRWVGLLNCIQVGFPVAPELVREDCPGGMNMRIPPMPD
jgi:hypothetical protein